MENSIVCKKCKILKPLTKEFFKTTFNKKYQKEYLEKTCKSCRHKKQVKRARERYHSDSEFKNKTREHKEKYRLKHKNARDQVWSKSLETGRLYKQKNKQRIRERDKLRHSERWKNPVYRLSKLVSNKINLCIKNKNSKSWTTFVDYTVEDLIKHLESKFLEGMNWCNHGKGKDKWHIDHIIPISHFKFDSHQDEQFRKCWALSNLQPKWEIDNLKKGNRFIG